MLLRSQAFGRAGLDRPHSSYGSLIGVEGLEGLQLSSQDLGFTVEDIGLCTMGFLRKGGTDSGGDLTGEGP